jgi:sec-independent protein translocase protein TatC
MTLMEHLAELRRRLIISVIAVGVGMVVVWIFFEPILDLLIRPLETTVDRGDGPQLLQTDPVEGFTVRLRVAGYGGVALAMPMLLWQAWRFVSPGLYANEKRYAIPFMISGLTLFSLGAWLAYGTLPRALGFLADIGGDELEQFYTPGSYIRLVTFMMLAFGVGFLFPIFLIFLQLAGIVETGMLRGFRRYAIVIIFVVVAIITPSGDPYSLLALATPMVLFYEAAIVFGRIRDRRRAAAGLPV